MAEVTGIRQAFYVRYHAEKPFTYCVEVWEKVGEAPDGAYIWSYDLRTQPRKTIEEAAHDWAEEVKKRHEQRISSLAEERGRVLHS